MIPPREKPAVLPMTRGGTRTGTLPKEKIDDRLPPPGTVLTRKYKGGTVQVKVLANGFEYAGVRSEHQWNPGANPAKVTTQYFYDQLNRQIGVKEAIGTPLERQTSFVYDRADNLIAEVDPLAEPHHVRVRQTEPADRGAERRSASALRPCTTR